MKSKSIIALITLALFALSSCQNNIQEKIEYTPVDGYNGKVRKITEYKYKSEMEKQEQLAIWGTNIPERIAEYNEYGRQTLEIDIDIPDDIDEDFVLPTNITKLGIGSFSMCSKSAAGSTTM